LATPATYADGGVVMDGGAASDAGSSDAGPLDAGGVDGGPEDAGVVDGGRVDAGVVDGGPEDAGVVDGGAADAGIVDAGEVDAGKLDAGPVPCGDIDARGQCNGDTLQYCADDALVSVDCQNFFPAGTVSSCAIIDDDWGADCVVAAGEDCMYTDAEGERVLAFCEQGAGCFDNADADAAVCEADVGACTPSDSFAASCDGQRLTFDCHHGRPVGVHCPVDASCTPQGCIDVGRGGPCDDPLLACADGLVCRSGLCADPVVVEPEPAPTPTPEPEPTGCAARQTASTTTPLAALWLLPLGLGLARRRQSRRARH